MIFTVSVIGQVDAETPEEAATKFDEHLKPHYIPNVYQVKPGFLDRHGKPMPGRTGAASIRVERGVATRVS